MQPPIKFELAVSAASEGHSDGFGVGSLSIVGTGLKIDSADLVVGTGPLLFADKRDEHAPFVEKLSFVFLPDTASTWGSSLLSNSSFSSCITNDAPGRIERPTQDPTKDIKPHVGETARIDHSYSPNPTADRQVWVTTCAFSGLTSDSGDGAALGTTDYEADVIVVDSTFQKCRVTSSFSGGGAISLRLPQDYPNGKFFFTLFNCQFSNNTAAWFGGHFQAYYYHPATIAQCTFADSRSSTDTPLPQCFSMNINLEGDCRFDNSTLSNNEGSHTGGIRFFQDLYSGKIVMTDVLFQDNVCTATTDGNRVTDCIFYSTLGVTNNQFFDCFSTSDQPHCGTHTASQLYPDLIGPAITSIGQTKQENEKGDGFEVALSFEGVFTGTSRKYDVTLETADGTQFVAENMSFTKKAGSVTIPVSNPSTSSLSPSTKYTIVDVKKSVTDSTSNEMVFEDETEPDWSWWHHTSSSRANNMVGLSFTTPTVPKLTKIETQLNPLDSDEAIVTVTMDSILAGSFTLIVFEKDDASESPITVGSVALTTSPSETSSMITITLTPSGPLSHGNTYTVKTFSSSTLLVDHANLALTIPIKPPRISKASASLSGTNKTWVDVVLTGEALPQGKGFTIVVKEMEGGDIKDGAKGISLTGTIEGSSGKTDTCTASVEIYNKSDTLEYSKKYKIESLDIPGFSCIVDSTVNFTVPDSPGRVEKIITPTLNGEKTKVSVIVVGVGFASTISEIVVKRGDHEISSTSISSITVTQLTATFGAGKAETSLLVEFGKTYSIVEVSTESEVYVNSGVGFTVPVPGIVSSTSSELNPATNEEFKVIVNGENFVIDSEWNMTLTGRSEVISVRMTSTKKGESSWVKAGGPGELEFDHSYTLSTMTQKSNASEHILCSGVSLTTPPGPTLTGITCSLNPSNLNEAIVHLTASPISTGSFTLIVFDASDALKPEISIGPFSFTSSSTPTSSSCSVVILPSEKMSFGKTYTVKSLSSPSMFVAHTLPTFSVPYLVKAASSSLNLENLNEVVVSVTAFGFPPATSFTLTIVEVDKDNQRSGSTFELTGTTSSTAGDTTHCLNSPIEAGKLQHAKRFEITKCEVTNRQVVLDEPVFFPVPAPPTLTKASFSFATSSHTSFNLMIEGSDLPEGEIFVVTLDGFDKPIDVEFKTTTLGVSEELALGWADGLNFSSSYKLNSLSHKVLSTFSIPTTDLTLVTDSRPDPLILFANDSVHSDPKFCGAKERPCSSLDVAWMIVEAYSAQTVSLVVVKEASLSSPISIGAEQDVIVEKHLLTQKLVIPSTASLGNSTGLVSVSGTLEMREVHIDIQVEALSFVLFDVEEGKLVLKDVQISGIPSSSELIDGIDGLCAWETGLIKLHNSSAEIENCRMSSIEMGEIWMESSNLSLISTQILSNGARFSSFPSAQQDVMCKSGNITILPSASDTTTDRWISSSSECSVTLNGSEVKSPHFVPSLDAKNCTSTQSKKKDSFSISIHAGSIIDQYTGEPRLSLSAVVPLHEQDYDVTVQREESNEAETMRVRMIDDSTVRNWIADDETTTLDYLATYTITKIVGVVPPSEAASNGVFTEPKLAWEFDLASTPESLTFVAPEAPPILKASCRLGNGSNHAWIKLTGLNITAGTYTVTLVGVSGFSFGVTFASETDEKGRPLSEETPVRLFGEGSTLTFDTEYQIDTVINSTSQEPLNLAEMIITFTTPVATSRIIGMGEETLTLPQKDSVSVPLYGTDMKDTTYLVEVSLSDVVLEEPLSAVFSANSGTLVGRVYSASGSEVPLEYGNTYAVVSVTNSAFDAVLFNPFIFTVPTEPARIKSISPKLNREKSEVIVELTGVQFFASPALFVHLKNTNTGRAFSSSLTIKNAESCSVSFPTAQSEDDTHLQFELGYLVTSVASVDGLSSFLFNEGLEVTVPHLPVVDTITSSLSPSCTTFQVSMTGSHLPLTGSFTATLSPAATMTVNFVDGVGTSLWLSDGVDGMKLNTTYTIIELANDDDVILVNDKIFTTTEGPTLLSIDTPTLKSDNPNVIELTLNGERMPLKETVPEFSLVVVEKGQSTEISIPVSFSTNSLGGGEAVAYPSSTLKYSTAYSVLRMTSTTVPVSIPSSVSFTTPASPTRIISAFGSLDSKTGKTAEISLTGIGFPQSKDFTIIVRELDALSQPTGSPIELSSSFGADGASTSHTMTTPIFRETSAKLEFGKSCVITDLVITGMSTVVDSDVTFKVPTEPSRLISIHPATYSNEDREVSASLFGIKLSGTYWIVLESNTSAPDVNVSVSITESGIGELKGILYSKALPLSMNMTYDTLYKIVGMEDSSQKPIFFENGLTFFTMKEPTRIEDGVCRLNSKHDKVIVTLNGRVLSPGDYSVLLTHTDPNKSRTIAGNVNRDGNVECSHTVDANEADSLVFGETYSISSAHRDGTPIHVTSGLTLQIPHPPKVTEAIVHPNTLNTAVTIELLGTDLNMMKEFKVTIRPSFSFVVLFADASRGLSPTLRLDSTEGLAHNSEYVVESIVGVVDSDEMILIDGLISFRTPELILMEVIVSCSGVGSEGEECGSLTIPCATLLIGWEMGRKKGDIEKLILKVRDSVESGGVVVVGRGSVEVRGMFGEKCRMMISEQATPNTKSESVFVVDGGEVILLDLIVCLPSFTSVWGWHAGFVVGGEGSVIVDEVEIVSRDGEKAGMGLVELKQGGLNVDGLFVRNIEFCDGVGLIRCLGGRNEIGAEIMNLVVENATLSEEGIVAFSSTEKTSEILMADSELWRVRTFVGEGTGTALIAIRTGQTRLTISKCVFFESGCYVGNGVKIGHVLLITLHSSDRHETVQHVDLDCCLFVDCAGRDGREEGGVLIRSGDGLCRVSLNGSWFEERSELSSPSSFDRGSEGRVVVTKRRMSYLGWKRAGVVIERGRRLPVIDRKGSGFSNCGLMVVGMEVERARHNSEKMDEL
ncbi:hypothetical protein BLNAU_10674 [Blattamonas nauphoetae]|uniref:Uncharacterized protein n=1 Tax=Blattamonas nauphoetae TaxID=2049346 RepID=A0ABQ9XSS1_9EUKA|nr:hypothetical protein BLNAU_10674 [Blattamonas nauphoetae]